MNTHAPDEASLLPCPFCPHGQSIVSLWHDDVSNRWRVGCGRCGCSTGISPRDKTQAPAIAAWNKRSDNVITNTDALLGRQVWDFIDRMNDPGATDPAERILADFVAAVGPIIDRSDASGQSMDVPSPVEYPVLQDLSGVHP